MPEPKTIEFFVAMNEEGDFVLETEEGDALSKLAEDQGGYNGRVVKVTMTMMPPKTTEVEVVAQDEEEGETTVASKGGTSEAL